VLLGVPSHHWYDLSWIQWFSAVGLPLTLAGLYLTWRQARDASNTARATRNAVQRTQQQIRVQQLMVLIPQLMWTAAEIDSAIELDNFSLVRRYLNNWRRQAGNVHGILLAANPEELDTARDVNTSISMASIAEEILLKGSKASRADCMKARNAISAAVDRLGSWVGKNSTQATDRGGEK
jgi:hypothetical protein